MMIHAYHVTYLNKMQAVLGEAFDYAINTCKISGEIWIQLLIASSLGKRLENGEPSLLAGKSGAELVQEILIETTGRSETIEPHVQFNRSPEYWIGWVIAYYQWWSDKNFGEIAKLFAFHELRNLYETLHEADISKFVEIAEQRSQLLFPETNLKRIRSAYGCTQAELAKMSGVSLRSIQMYEQRNKNINKANADTIYRLSKVLGCPMESLIEKA